MCGIVGYAGYRRAAPILLQGLRRLEYRGYDSYGIATLASEVCVHKKAGKVSDLPDSQGMLQGTIGIGHTRWATHGIPSDVNAHPHQDCTDKIAVVHNGIIENYAHLKRELIGRGHTFRSETDTEVIAHLIEEAYAGDLLEAVRITLPLLTGSYALLIISAGEDRLIAARNQSPLVLGIGDGEIFAASDITPLLEYTSRIIYLDDGDIAELKPDSYSVYFGDSPAEREIKEITWTPDTVQKGGFAHYMLKEIFEQPDAIHRAVHAVSEETLPSSLRQASSITVVACGSSYHAGMIFRYLIEPVCGIPVRLELGSEYKYTPVPFSDVIIGISQSGETADTLSAIRKGICNNVKTVAITNVLNSSITRSAHDTILMHAGPEISVAASKSFIAQVGVLMQIVNILSGGRCHDILDHARYALEQVLLTDLTEAVDLCSKAQHLFYVGRGVFYPVMMEGALKMKEISYIHAEAYAAGELKHGPFALLSPDTPVIAICTPGPAYEVMLGNMKEMKARGTPIVAFGNEDDGDVSDIADVVIPLPKAHMWTQVLTSTVLLQLLAYHTANRLGREIDMPRNLAKSVTVE
ncbi:glutamine--fructose-6-phosphate transaminase [Methanospirillum hungatei JF-1]|jgi:glucosamine--fructose-6-phosphate aminotransferase (isomerizing)|uniref:Glutamine--fructose-6-phosphate aminotransferase [isomerizing] n=1 Tax=Methanospirillum hungatei JF-1 (strain ATCC 27890 / DSM 864 / NBRC 100397 / JF-1) TaxID=323259 RepID=Q2FRV7_METHJ|nr:glutamine--fructose-6-phosphate transaminase (isomerizing) [Methanospirillum hungatei]MBP7034406.1 glutamine--fructose-6-phosphate transaminase (isomerizing) [Methanospirillum sp.]OQA59564.1 MAG: Glutamine--fructose-6-phosphate aminotransferase (isomerizing) [Euryarchaeota archaeon ADurb.Bin294]ABD42547.1 glutamine--fructose-6-phosphate transaminase [Methanospirillum hungatei JF-1]MBP9007923.1 glutamine--fructose-6-phosphate transaminase (isomerizing) [Methanospirillum sp.]HOW04708.1 glutam